MKNKRIAMLCSCAGFGTYTPCLLLKKELEEQGFEAKVFVFEHYISGKNNRAIIEYRKQFHRSFRFAVMASKLAEKTSPQEMRVECFEENCNVGNYDSFIVFYGEWLAVLSTLNVPADKIMCIRLDAIDTPSWIKSNQLHRSYETIWFVGNKGNKPKYRLRTLAREDDAKSVILHGGGWGINSYLDVIDSLKNDYRLNIIYSSPNECRGGGDEYYIPIDWTPSKTDPDFPPLYSVARDEEVCFHDLCKCSCAIVSKPGGGTCLDALRYSIPLIMLEPMAIHEKANALLFEQLGFAISFKSWEANGYSFQDLLSAKTRIEAELFDVPLLSEYICRK